MKSVVVGLMALLFSSFNMAQASVREIDSVAADDARQEAAAAYAAKIVEISAASAAAQGEDERQTLRASAEEILRQVAANGLLLPVSEIVNAHRAHTGIVMDLVPYREAARPSWWWSGFTREVGVRAKYFAFGACVGAATVYYYCVMN